MVFIKLANIFIEIITPFLPHFKVPKSLFYNPMGASFMLNIRGTEKNIKKNIFLHPSWCLLIGLDLEARTFVKKIK